MDVELGARVEHDAYDTAKGPAGTIIGVLGIVAALGLGLWALHGTIGLDVRMLLRDPAETAMLPEYAGALSYLGVLLLWSAGLVGLVTAALLRVGRRSSWRLFAGLGVGCCWLAADDLFMIHEWMGLVLSRIVGAENEYLGRTRLEGVVFGLYGVVALAWLVRNRTTILRGEWVFLALGIGCLGLSVSVDVGEYILPGLESAGQAWETAMTYAEELMKIAGILFMVVYIARMSFATIHDLLRSPRSA
jgi:hypothetical protein